MAKKFHLSASRRGSDLQKAIMGADTAIDPENVTAQKVSRGEPVSTLLEEV